MRNLLIALFICAPVFSFSQERIEVKEETVDMAGTSRNALTVVVIGFTEDDVAKAWKKQLKGLKGKVSDEPVILGDDCQEKTMGDGTFDVYSMIQQVTEGMVKLAVAFDIEGAFLSSMDHPEKFAAAQKIIRDFAVVQARVAVETEIETSRKILKGLEKDLVGLEKDKEKLEKDVTDFHSKIDENKASIQKNITDQASKQKEVHRLEGTQAEGQIDEVQKLIKDFKKEIKGMVKDKERLEKENEELTDRIKQAKAAIQQNATDQTNKKEGIEGARSIIQNLEIKLHAIN